MNVKAKFKHFLLVIITALFLTIGYPYHPVLANSRNGTNNFNLFDFLSQILNSFVNYLDIPDLGSIFGDIIGSSENPHQQGGELAGTLENRPPDSYSILEDVADKTEQDLAIQIANDTTLSQEAQTNSINLAQAVEANVAENVQLGEESQNLDVSQQILQNLSQQTALNAQTQGIIIQQNQHSQLNQALTNLLNAQQAEELSESNTAQRREKEAAGKASIAQAGLLFLPGGITLNSGNNSN